MQFQIPQFIDIEPKIVGPLTIKQFLYLTGGIVPSFILFFLLAFWLWIFVAAILVSIGAALAFFKINGQPLTKIITSAFFYFWKPRFYIWEKVEERAVPISEAAKEPKASPLTPLKDLLLKIMTSTHPIGKREKPSISLSLLKQTGENLETFRKTTGERKMAKRIDYR